ncbi:MAG: hypothetical protein ABFD89_23775 [Bryobacteraceae bacterium]
MGDLYLAMATTFDQGGMAMETMPYGDMEMMGDVDGPGGVDLDRLEKAILQVLHEGTEKAKTRSRATKAKWADWINMKYGQGFKDDPGDILTEKGVGLRMLAKFTRTYRSQVMRQLVPNPAEHDWISVTAKMPGLEGVAEAVEALMQDRFREMRPEDARNFYGLLPMHVDDWLTLGNMMAMPTHEYFIGDVNDDDIEHGPVVQYLDPFNVWPWSVQVNQIAKTDVTVYDPVDRYELDKLGLDEAMVKRIEATAMGGQQTLRRDKDAGGELDDEANEPEDLLERQLYFGKFPFYEIREVYGEDLTLEAAIEALAGKFGFERDKAGGHWWQGEWIGDVLMDCSPYPLELPAGCGPIMHESYIHRNNQLWGLGMFDGNAIEERLATALHKDVIRLSKMAARPPRGIDLDAIDAKWRQEHGSSPTFEPDQMIPFHSNVTQGRAFIQTIDVNTAAIPHLTQEIQRHEANMRDDTGVTTAVEGQDQSKTATQNANNLQQSLSLQEYDVTMLENGWLREMLVRCYLIERQAMTLADRQEVVSMSTDEQKLKALVVRPEDMRQSRHFRLEAVGSTMPGNKSHMAKAMADAGQMYLQTGALNLPEWIKVHLRMMGIRNVGKLLTVSDPTQVMEYVQNLVGMFGPAGLAFLPTHMQQAFQQLMGGGMGAMGGGAMGGNGMPGEGVAVPMTGEQGPAGLPMMAGGGM